MEKIKNYIIGLLKNKEFVKRKLIPAIFILAAVGFIAVQADQYYSKKEAEEQSSEISKVASDDDTGKKDDKENDASTGTSQSDTKVAEGEKASEEDSKDEASGENEESSEDSQDDSTASDGTAADNDNSETIVSDNTGSSTGNSSTGNTGSSTGNTSTGNTGSSTGNSSSGNTGSSTGNSSSGNAGSSTGSSSSGNTGSSTGNTSTGNTGSSTGSSSSANTAQTSKGYTVAYKSNNSWESNGATVYGLEIQIKNSGKSAVSGWTLVLEIDGLSNVDGWNGTYTISGNKMTIKDVGYNSDISSGGVISIGCNLGVKSALKIKSATLNGVACSITNGTVVADSSNNGNSNNSSSNNSNNNSSNSNSSSNSNNYSGEASASKTELLKRSEDAVQGDDWLHTDGNKIYDKNGKEVWITGVNWFGYNTGTNTFDGLWNSELVSSIEAIADHGFNLIRVPMSAQLINQWAAGTYPKANYNNAYNPDLNSMNSLEIFDYFLKVAEENGLKVMPDIHSAETDSMGHMSNLWYTSNVSTNQYYKALEWMAERYKNNDTIIAYDLKNEPHGKPYEGSNAAIWNNSQSANNWKYVAETAAKKVLAKNPNVLIMVEGIEIYPKNIKTNGNYSSTNDGDYYFNWWGGNLRGVADYPINLGKYQNKLVYSPHDYGPAVYEQPWFKGGYDYNSLMKDCWYDNWFYIYDEDIAPLLIGEWGGYMTQPNLTWMTHMRTLIKKYHLHHTFWCYNANSGDTGGLVLDDFKTWDQEKYSFVKEVLWQESGKFVGLDHAIPLGSNGITLSKAKGL